MAEHQVVYAEVRQAASIAAGSLCCDTLACAVSVSKCKLYSFLLVVQWLQPTKLLCCDVQSPCCLMQMAKQQQGPSGVEDSY
jgi:hypothetical protein